MDLGDIYQNNINKTPINKEGMPYGIPSSRERDPNQVKLENDVFKKMRDAIPKPMVDDTPEPELKVDDVGFEQALKELLNGTESVDDKS